MKHSFLFLVLSFIIACKSSEGIDNDSSNLRMDGFYMAKSLFSTAKPDTVNGMPVERNSMKLLRFYNLDSGVIIPENMPKDFQMTAVEIERYYKWCEEYEVKNPADKDFVNFQFKLYGKDSIRFSQVSPNTQIEYTGKVFKDSIALNYVMHPMGMGASVSLPAKPIYFKFYPKTK
ncbi:MAG: hypothetical protein JWO09_976 [Bacteroidetes bacterium]|nr:hypothetical protein [Bacteroidota bacterium]